MKACGLIVEYNPFHNGHLYHINQARKTTNADCIIAVMSGPFLQRGEPAIIDKFHRARAALTCGADLVVELPYPYAVQSSELFAKGAVMTLNALGVSYICFGSESGRIDDFITSVNKLVKNKTLYDESLRTFIKQGLSFPHANSKAFATIGLDEQTFIQPNNILGFSYVKSIIENSLPIEPFTIKRIQNDFHDEDISNKIASATSIRKELNKGVLSKTAIKTLPLASRRELELYKDIASLWHHWDDYFPLLQYRVTTMTIEELKKIHGMEEGLENRIKKTVKEALSFQDWMEKIKTRRYTKVRLQRVFVHILTNTTKEQINQYVKMDSIPYIRLLGMTDIGRKYLNTYKQQIECPIFTNLNNETRSKLFLDERANDVYYSVLSSMHQRTLRKQDFRLPIMV